MSDPFTTVVTAEPRYNLAVQEGGGLTLSLLGPAGPAGATGAAGAAGPNSVTNATTSDGTADLSVSNITINSDGTNLGAFDIASGMFGIQMGTGDLYATLSSSNWYGTTFTGSHIQNLGTTDTPTFANLSLASGTITTSQPLSLTQTWNASGVTFKGIDVNVTDTASASGSLLMDLRVGGVSKAKIEKDGSLYINGNISRTGNDPVLLRDATEVAKFGSARSVFRGISIGASIASPSVFIERDADNTLAQRNGTNAQESRIYDTYTSATDYHRLAIATARATATAMSGATVTLTNIIPAGAVVVGVTCKVTTAITGATSFDIGTGADVDRFGAAIATALGTTSDNRNWTAGTVECFPSATSIILTANGSNFTAGAVYVSVQYLSGQAD